MLIAAGLGGKENLNAIPFPAGMVGDSYRPLRVARVIIRHCPYDIPKTTLPVLGSAVKVDARGIVTVLRAREASVLVPFHVPAKKVRIGKVLSSAYFFLAYGRGYEARPRGEDFDFLDVLYRRTRFQSLLRSGAPLTNPVDFLARLRYKGIRMGRPPSKNVLYSCSTLLSQHLNISTSAWLDTAVEPEDVWNALAPWQQRAVLPVLDMARHMVDAFPRSTTPLEMPGVVVMDRPETFCTPGRFKEYMTLLDRLFPSLQFIVSMGRAYMERLPSSYWEQRLALPEKTETRPAAKLLRLSKKTILLIDVDGTLPNLALMKLSSYHKQKGHPVWLGKRGCFLKDPGQVYASSLFYSSQSERRIQELKDYYGKDLILGGTGADIRTRLPKAIESLRPDYDLYPELGDRAIGFITRGCRFACPFCVVPPKEGKPRQVCDLDTLLEGGRRTKLILLDDNILSHPDADQFLQEMAERCIMVNFTQTLDLRLVNRDRARMLRRIQCSNTRFTRINFHFSLNHNRNLDLLARKYRLFDFKAGDNVEFICMYGYDTTLKEDVERFTFLNGLPGAYVFTQKYLPLRGVPVNKQLDFFGKDPDMLLDQLIGIQFSQNMKSMENYYRWVSRQYAIAYGKLHMGLVETLFRYNQRHLKGEYIATLAGTRKKPV